MWHHSEPGMNERGICKYGKQWLAESEPMGFTVSVWSVLQWQVSENQLVVIPHRYIANTHFYITTEMTASEKLRLLCWGSVWVQISGWLREVPNSTTWYTACAAGCTAQKQLYSALHPKYFWDEKTILWLPYSLLFLVYICHALCVGSARTPRERVLCWPLQPGASAGRQQDPSGTGTVTRNVKIAACAERLWLRTHFAITFKVSVGLTLAVL